MAPTVTVLQLDTHFPRIAGDVGCAATYKVPPQIITIPGATVGDIVTAQPSQINIAPFADALARATGDVIATSCGFLASWQQHLAARTPKPFVSSALIALDHLSALVAPDDLMIVTFDADRLNATHLGGHQTYAKSIIGLRQHDHLRRVISQDLPTLEPDLAREQLVQLVTQHQRPNHRHILMECTNLPPYRAALRQATGLPVSDILTEIDRKCPNSIAADFV